MKRIFQDKKIIMTMLSILLVLSIMTSTTYSLLFRVDTLENVESYTAGVLQIEVDKGESLTLTNTLPMEDVDGEVSTPYTFKIKNTGNLTYTFDLKLLSTTSDNPINYDYIKVKVDDGEIYTFSSLVEGLIYEDIILNPGQSKIISVRIWLDYSTPNTEIGKNFSAKMVIDGVGSEFDSPAFETLQNLNLTNLLNTEIPNFSNVATTDEGIYAAEDDLGTSYYFRGASEHNYVKLASVVHTYVGDLYVGIEPIEEEYTSLELCQEVAANCYALTEEIYAGYPFVDENKYFSDYECMSASEGYFDCGVLNNQTITRTFEDMWFRIIRINGDGSIRMIYDGEEVHRNGTVSDNVIENIYGIEQEQWKYAENNLLIEWYSSNIKNNIYGEYVSDSIFCEDNEIVEGNNDDESCPSYYHASYNRINVDNPIPSLMCSTSEDKLSQTTQYGTGTLVYPVGLITIDEVSFAGGRYGIENNKFYLYNGQVYSTISPYVSNSCTPITYYAVNSDGRIVTGGNAYRPVINLKAGTPFTGTGTWDDPFVIKLSE